MTVEATTGWESDLAAARRRSELLVCPCEEPRAHADTYLSYERDQSLDHPHIGAWSGYQVVRDVVLLTVVMETVRRAHLTDDVLPTFSRMRTEVDATGILPAQFHRWMMANHVKSETVRRLTETSL
ncbi:hypothetical protein [Kitasatospora sp. MY 5-36]|uniref:hypothetical protein n=1 Tax=Kitasatospora sp. MY 5-36 TaxID=1678027 RepID=UPI000671007E|nr:hypothetical protein [Kitasatospora sp. MY 5-36]